MGVNSKNGGLFFNTGLNLQGLKADSAKAKGILGSLTSSITKQDIGAAAVLGLGVAFIKVAKSAKEFSEQMETSLTEVATISDYVTANMDSVYESIAKMSTETAQEQLKLSDALYDVVSAGYDEADAFTVLNASARASTAGFIEVGDAVDGVTTVLNAWGKSADEAEAVTDVFLTTVKKGKTTFGEYAGSISSVAPLASSLGISFEEVSGAVASLTKQGVPTTVALTQIRGGIIAVAQNMGAGIFETESLQGAMAKFADSMDGDFNKLKDAAGRIEGVNGILGVTGANAEEAAKDLDAMSNSLGTTDAAFEKAIVTSENQSLILGENIKKATKPLGDFFSKTGTNIAESINEMFNSGAIETFADTLKIVIPILGAYAIGSKIAAASTLDYLIALESLQKGFARLTATMLNNPMVVAAAAITAATILIVKGIKNYRDEQKALNSDIQELTKTISTNTIELDSLFQVATGAADGTDERRAAIEAINEKYGDYLPNLLDEKSSLEDIRKAYEDVSAAMSRKAIEQFKAQDIQDATELFVEKYKDAVSDFEKKIRKSTGSDIEASLSTQALKDYAAKIRSTQAEIAKLRDYSDPEKNKEEIAALSKEQADMATGISERYKISTFDLFQAAKGVNKIYEDQGNTIKSITDDYAGLSEGLKKTTTKTKELTTAQKESLLQETIAADLEEQLNTQLAKFKEYQTAKDVLSEEELKKRYETQVKYGGDEREYLKVQLKEYEGNVTAQLKFVEILSKANINLFDEAEVKTFADSLDEQKTAFEEYNKYKDVLTEEQINKEYSFQKEYSGNYKKYLVDQLKEYEGNITAQKAIIDAAIKEGIDFGREAEPVFTLPTIKAPFELSESDLTDQLDKLRTDYDNAKTEVEKISIKMQIDYVATKLDATEIEIEAKTEAEKLIAINEKIEALKRQSSETTSQQEKENIDNQILYWNERAGVVAKGLEAEKELYTDVHELTLFQIKKEISSLNKRLETERLTAEQIAIIKSRLQELNKEGMTALLYSAGEFLNVMETVTGELFKGNQQAQELSSTLITTGKDYLNAIGAGTSGDVGGLVASMTKVYKSLWGFVTDIFDDTTEQFEALQEYAAQAATEFELINEQLEKINTNSGKVKALAGYWKEVGEGISVYVKGAIEEAQEATEAYEAAIRYAIAANLELSDSEAAKFTTQQLINMAIAEGAVGEELDANIEKWKLTKEQVIELEEQLKELRTGTTASKLADDFFNLFEQGKTEMQDFADYFEDVMKNAITEIFKQKFIVDQMGAWYELLAEYMEDGALSPEEKANLRREGERIADQASAAWAAIESAFPELEDVSSEASLAGDIARSITEDTASIIAGTLNGMLSTSIQIRETTNEMLFYQKKIAQNTLRSADKLDQIYEVINEDTNNNAVNSGLI